MFEFIGKALVIIEVIERSYKLYKWLKKTYRRHSER